MIKKTIQSFIFFATIQVLVFSCCEETYNIYYTTIEFTAIDALDSDTATIASEDLVLNLNTLYEYVQASNYNALKQFSHSAAYATTCDEDYILRETLISVDISANEDILGITAGHSLNEIFSFINPETHENEIVESIIPLLNQQNYLYNNQIDFVLNQTLESETSLIFTITLSIEENDRILTASTQIITIE